MNKQTRNEIARTQSLQAKNSYQAV